MKKQFKIFSILFIIIFLSLFIVYFWFFQLPIETKTVKMHVLVSNYTGFNLDTDVMYFGSVPGKGSVEKGFNLTNSGNENLIVNIYSEGNISQFVSFSKNNFVLKPDSIDNILVIADIPEGTELGEYSGTLYITFRRSIY
ncbi:MAG: hypothetical protein KJ613_03550 [Nanoarchaeota archaeon]|nr:hypothetical protein [Nanoarchaeota archaeon]MBU1135418.1 hypothetical protein [Nanoarchaeota archaeon]